jgi:multiple antibiotic resistance protein
LNYNFKEIFTASLILFAVINIIGSIPIIISLREKVGHIESEKTSLVAGVIMIAFLFVGKNILNLIGIDVNSFAVAGSLIIFFIALEMIMGISIYKNDVPETASIIPIAFPIIAGPGSLTTLLSLRAEFELINIILAVLFNIAIVFLILKSTNIMSKILGKSGIAIIQKVFGIILLSIAVKLFATNVGQIIN